MACCKVETEVGELLLTWPEIWRLNCVPSWWEYAAIGSSHPSCADKVVTRSSSDERPACEQIPQNGKWADGKLHGPWVPATMNWSILVSLCHHLWDPAPGASTVRSPNVLMPNFHKPVTSSHFVLCATVSYVAAPFLRRPQLRPHHHPCVHVQCPQCARC